MIILLYKEHGRAFSDLDTAPESKVESMLQELPHSPVKKKLKTAHSPRKVMAAVFWVVYRDLLIDFTPLSSTINADAYEETQKRL